MESSTDRKLLDLEPPVDERMEQMVSGMLEELMTTSKKGTTVESGSSKPRKHKILSEFSLQSQTSDKYP